MGAIGVGTMVTSKFDVRLAEKKGGVITGKMVSIFEGDIGTVVGVTRGFKKRLSYLVRFMGSDVTMMAQHFKVLGSEEDHIPRDVMDKVDMDAEMREDDNFDDAEY